MRARSSNDTESKRFPRASVRRRRWLVGVMIFICIFGVYGGVAWWHSERILRSGSEGYIHVIAAAQAFRERRFSVAHEELKLADREFAVSSRSLRIFPGFLVDALRFIPGCSQLASGRNALLAGEHIAQAGIPLAMLADQMMSTDDPVWEKPSILLRLERARQPLSVATIELRQANALLDRVSVFDIPEEHREQFLRAKELLPTALGVLSAFGERERVFADLLGVNGPRKYLFLFQNNHELRATGGFIGSYALLSVHDGILEDFFVDGIFNPDGQLRENIVPPKPIQKISAGWSLHDSNWYPDFPTSAKKAISFYEKTGGPTVDGVVTMTPVVIQSLLEILGPIDLPEYGVTIDAENFIQIVQEQVEEKYDKQENKPKKILSDLSLQMLTRMLSLRDHRMIIRSAEAMVQSLNEKHILLYASHPETESLIDQAGWSGALLSADQDFVSVVHSNINGYKTDGVIRESIAHQAAITSDGSITDTLSITRQHQGGHTSYEWWNKVNADYLRVYVPLGAELLSVKGTTWEFPNPPLDYDALGFHRDSQVEAAEALERIDGASGTRIGEENGKTVFGSWVYVSPGESVTVELTYRLPFKVDMEALRQGKADRFSILYQKQSGTLGSQVRSEILFPERIQNVWQTGGDLIPYERKMVFEGILDTDHLVGTVLMRE